MRLFFHLLYFRAYRKQTYNSVFSFTQNNQILNSIYKRKPSLKSLWTEHVCDVQIPKTKFKKTESVSIEYNEFVVCITAIINAFDVFYRIYNTIVHMPHVQFLIPLVTLLDEFHYSNRRSEAHKQHIENKKKRCSFISLSCCQRFSL